MSARYATAVAALALGALLPTIVHNYLGLTVDDGIRVAAMKVEVPGLVQAPTSRNAGWFKEHFESDDALELEFSGAPGGRVKLTVIRSLNAKLLFHHPENVVAYGAALHDHDIVALPELPGVPVHRLRTELAAEGSHGALYVLRYSGQYVANPILFQAKLTGALLIGGRAPMTLVFVQSAGRDGALLTGSAEAKVLSQAVASVVAQEGLP